MKYLNNWVDGLIIRHPNFSKMIDLSHHALIPIINAMSSENHPCPPFFRGQEVSEDVINSEYFVGQGFKKNLLYVQQAIIVQCLGLFKEGADIL